MILKTYRLKDYNFMLIVFTLLLSVIGVFAISSDMGEAGTENVHKQIGGIIVGTVMMIVISLIDYHFILKFWIPIYIGMTLVLFMVMVGGYNANNAQRWLKIGFIRFQPSEMAKLMLILFFAAFIMKYREKISNFHLLLVCSGLFIVPFFLVYKQPDLSTSLVMIFIFSAIMFTSGIKKRIILVILLRVPPLL